MPITNQGLAMAAIRLGSNISVPAWIAIGSGSGTATTSDVVLIAETSKSAFVTSDFSVAKRWTFDANFSASSLSGLSLREFAVFSASGAAVGSAWQRDAFAAIVFDGTSELTIECDYDLV